MTTNDRTRAIAWFEKQAKCLARPGAAEMCGFAVEALQETKHGKWEDENPIEPNPMFRAMVCSVCGRTEGSPNDFCPYCGARMDGEV